MNLSAKLDRNIRIILTLVISFGSAGILLISVISKINGPHNSEIQKNTNATPTVPLALFIDSGEINNKIGLDMTRKLNKSNGKYINLYVENNGSNSVVATINGQSERTFEPGEKGHIYVEVTQGLLGTDKEHVFQVLTGTNGGSVNIHYEITQRDTQ